MRNTLLALSALALSLLPACSNGGEAGVGGGELFVRSCSLGCSDGASGVVVTCQIQSTVQNTEISVLFSEPIDLTTVSSTSFRVVNVDNGTTPVGEYFLDPNDSRRVIFRPALTFDLNGVPSFGFNINTPYQITIPGVLQGDTGPFIRSAVGRENQSRMDCTILTTDQITDPVPGPPIVKVYADFVKAYDSNGMPSEIDLVTNAFGVFDGVGSDGLDDNQINGGVQRIDGYRTGSVYMLFQDVMNPATLANPVTMTSSNISVRNDEDGNLATTADRSEPILGAYRVSVDTELLQTLVTFTPNNAFLSAGVAAPATPRLTVVDIPPACVDLAQLPVTPLNGGGLSAFVTELGVATDIILPQAGGETFADSSREDAVRSGGLWGTNGRLTTDIGGGSGRLGELIVNAGQTVTLNTDSQSFPLGSVRDLIGNPDGGGNYPAVITVTDGVFEFSMLLVQPGGILRLEGSNPARILVRGEANISPGSMVDLSGISSGVHDSTIAQPEATLGTPVSGPANGALGGWGGDRADFDEIGLDASVFIAIGGNNAPEAVPTINDGRDGGGVGGTAIARGVGGIQNTPFFPTVDVLNVVADPPGVPTGAHGSDFGPNWIWEIIFAGSLEDCFVKQVGIAGSGGGYALDGGDGLGVSMNPVADFPAAADNNTMNPGGSVAALGLAIPSETNAGYQRRTLDHTLGGAYPGFLRGGSGGGGGGNHMYDTKSSASLGNGCALPGTEYQIWVDHSGAKGGDGGGALHIAAGKTLLLNGTIDLSGGNGGSSTGLTGADRYAMPGGGGSGGALRVQAKNVLLSPLTNRIDVSGGSGGSGAWANDGTDFTSGGDGSRGLVRIENGGGSLTHGVVATSITPYEGDAMAPFDDVDKSLDFLSIANGGFQQSTSRPDSICASTSCWIELPSGFSVAAFLEDDVELGWDMDVIWNPGGSEMMVPYRANSATFPTGFEATFGNHLGPVGAAASPVVVRFQGARVSTPLSNPCAVSVSASNSPLQFGSLTPWVQHPAELNEFGPNIIRFVVMFDNTVDNGSGDTPGNTLSSVRGVTNLVIRAEAE